MKEEEKEELEEAKKLFKEGLKKIFKATKKVSEKIVEGFKEGYAEDVTKKEKWIAWRMAQRGYSCDIILYTLCKMKWTVVDFILKESLMQSDSDLNFS